MHVRFFGDTLGGVAVTAAGHQFVKFPNVVFLRRQAPTGGSKGSTVDHISALDALEVLV